MKPMRILGLAVNQPTEGHRIFLGKGARIEIVIQHNPADAPVIQNAEQPWYLGIGNHFIFFDGLGAVLRP